MRLHGPDTATLVQTQEGQPVTTDGPFVETFMDQGGPGGFSVIEVTDLDDALRWAERMSQATAARSKCAHCTDRPTGERRSTSVSM